MQTQSKLDLVDEKYQQTIIYCIVCLITKEKYVGSTILTLTERIRLHISQRNCSAWQILKRGNYKAYEIQHYPCNTLRERLVREGAWQRAYKKSFGDSLVNKQIEGTFYRNNPEAKREYNKQYIGEHKDESQAYAKQYREEHKDERQVYDKQYRKEHKEERQAYKKKPWTCEWCNKTMNTNSRSRHKKTWCKNKPVECHVIQ
jgi:hypothetical protein